MDPTPINQRYWEQSFDNQELHLALLTEFIDRRAGGEFETSGLTEFFVSYQRRFRALTLIQSWNNASAWGYMARQQLTIGSGAKRRKSR